jgi:hypothetical protein
MTFDAALAVLREISVDVVLLDATTEWASALLEALTVARSGSTVLVLVDAGATPPAWAVESATVANDEHLEQMLGLSSGPASANE